MLTLNVVYNAVVRRDDQLEIAVFDLGIEIGKDLDQHLADYVTEERPELTLIKVVSVSLEHKCMGCRNEEPGQRAHMDEGGCLHSVKKVRYD